MPKRNKPIKECCDNCKWWQHSRVNIEVPGACRRFPPVRDKEGKVDLSKEWKVPGLGKMKTTLFCFPSSKYSDFCGEFKLNKSKK